MTAARLGSMRLTSCGILLAWTLLGWSEPAFAYCRTTTAEPIAAVSCPDVCQTDGLPLYWPSRRITYGINERGFPGLSLATVRSIFGAAFTRWQDVGCDGSPIRLSIEQLSGTTPLGVGPMSQEPNENVLVYIPASEWDSDPHAFAVTKIWFSATTGHILGADMEFNGGQDPWGECPEPRGCVDESTTDLANVVTHEAGHFLGLAHTDVPDATMWCAALPGDVDKRSLEQDDEDGLCAIYGPDAIPDPEAMALGRRAHHGCSAAALPTESAALGSWMVLGIGLLARIVVARLRFHLS